MAGWNDLGGRFLKLKSLRPRLLLIVALALGPLALASIGQGLLRYQARQHEIDNQLLQLAMYATSNERSIFTSIERYLPQIRDRPEVRQGGAACANFLAATMFGRPFFVNVMKTDASGNVVCAAQPQTYRNFASFSWWKTVKVRKDFVLGSALAHDGEDKSILPLALPLRNRAGAFDGTLVAFLDLHWLRARIQYGALPNDALMLILDRSGAVVASNRPVPQAVAADIAQRGWQAPRSTLALKLDGTRWDWASEKDANNDVIMAFGIPEQGLLSMSKVYFFADILFPLLMIALASAAIWLGSEWLVIRWTTYLQRVSAAYAQNHFALELTELEDAPEEFRQLGYEMKNMANSIRDRDRRLNQALQQELAMGREIHHRVKNNLQVVSSLISLYSQRIADTKAQAAFRQIGARVDTLALIHRLIEKNELMPTVDMRALFAEMADQMRAFAAQAGKRYRLTLKVDEGSIPAELATPIAMFAVEGLAFELLKPENAEVPRIVKLGFGKDGPSHLKLTIEDGAFGGDALRRGVPAPERFLAAFAEQLDGNYWVEHEGGGDRLVLRVPIDAAQGKKSRRPIFRFRAGNAGS